MSKQEVIEYITVTLGLEESDAEELFNIACISMQESLELLDKYWTEQDSLNLSKTAHTIKGAFLNIGQDQAAELARTIEIKAKEGDMQLEEEVMQLKRMIQNFIS